MDSILAAHDWARAKAEPILTWLPDGLEQPASAAALNELLSVRKYVSDLE